MIACAALPVSGSVTSPFGWRRLNGSADYHSGIDLAAPEGSAVRAVLDGLAVVAASSGELTGYGNVVVLQHGPDLFSLYAHMRDLHVARGQPVPSGAVIGTVGRTAGTRADPAHTFAGPHLHFEFLRRWPPAGRDLDRLDPVPIFAQLGVLVPPRGPLQVACGSEMTPVFVEARPRPRSSGSGAGWLLAAFALWRYTRDHDD